VGAFIKVVLAGKVELPLAAARRGEGVTARRVRERPLVPAGASSPLNEKEREELRYLDHATVLAGEGKRDS
jgi:hypothetical protein